IISPGPGTPLDAGVSVDVVKHFAGKIPILGVCLGHQCIGYAFGAEIVSAARIVHGKVESMSLDGRGLFRNLPKSAVFTRYHSLAVKKGTLPPEFEITATAADGEIMGIRHKEYVLDGVQFHPESIASEMGKKVLQNFLYYHREAYPVKQMLGKLIKQEHLSFTEAQGFMEELTEGNLNHSQVAGILVGLNCKTYTAVEIAGFVKPEPAGELLDKTNFCFLFAPAYHGAMKHAVPVRRDLGIKTIMNLIGPLSNPAEAKMQLIGIYDKELCVKEAQAARLLGVEKVMVVHGADGMDEISVTAPTHVALIDESGELREYEFRPEEVGITPFGPEELVGGSAGQNVQLAREILDGGGSRAIRECVLLNAGAALFIGGRVSDIKQGYTLAREALESGKVKAVVEDIVLQSNRLGEAQKAAVQA
ncbi:MAG: anthranilate phosphoribosyltransferase, partial [Spirochaetia bacterium]